MSECDRTIETLETRITELDAENSVLFRQNAKLLGEVDDVKTDLAGAMKTLDLGRALFADLYKRIWVDGDDHDAQLQRMCDWAGVEASED